MKKLIKRKNNNGFTLLESLFSLLIVSLSFSLLLSVLPLLKKINEFDVSIEEEMAIAKLREVILYASDIDVFFDELVFYSMEEHMSLTLEKNRVVRHDGYVIYMDGLENSEFIEKGNCIFLSYERNGIQKERFLGCE